LKRADAGRDAGDRSEDEGRGFGHGFGDDRAVGVAVEDAGEAIRGIGELPSGVVIMSQ
jgi:hypothetical protein